MPVSTEQEAPILSRCKAIAPEFAWNRKFCEHLVTGKPHVSAEPHSM